MQYSQINNKLIMFVFIQITFLLLYLAVFPVNTKAFSTEEEIDNYYDSQINTIEEESARKNKEIEDQLQKDLDTVSANTQAKIWEMYKRVYGDRFEMVKPFLPESNPDPYYHANNLLNFDRETALRAIENISAVNEVLAKQVLAIYESKSTVNKKAPPSAQDLFNHLETLSNDEANETLELIKADNASLYSEIYEKIMTKYPNGKPGSATYNNYIQGQKTVSISKSEPLKKDSNSSTDEIKSEEVKNPSDSQEKTLTVTETELEQIIQEKMDAQKNESVPELAQPSFFQRIISFFKNWF